MTKNKIQLEKLNTLHFKLDLRTSFSVVLLNSRAQFLLESWDVCKYCGTLPESRQTHRSS